MAQLQPVPRAPSPFAGREGAIVTAMGLALLIAIVKPWGPGAGEPMPSPYVSPTASASPIASESAELRKEAFGPFEPTPEWSIWPAGYLTSLMYLERAPRTVAEASSGPPDIGSDASPATSAIPASSSSPPPGAEWPTTIDVGAGDHLLWIGINTPRGWSLDRAVLRRIGDGGGATVVATRRIATPWPDHFSALALTTRAADGGLAVWPAGEYSLELWASPGDVRRTLEIRIQTEPDPAPDLPSRQP